MTKRRYRLDWEAKRDIDTAFDYIARENLTAAQKYTRSLFKTIQNIAQNPDAGKLERNFSNIV